MATTTLSHPAGWHRKMLMLASVASLAIHGLVAWGVHDIPLGHINPGLWTAAPVTKVRLVHADHQFEPAEPSDKTSLSRAEPPPDPAVLSAAMLESVAMPELLDRTNDGITDVSPPERHTPDVDDSPALVTHPWSDAVHDQLLNDGPNMAISPVEAPRDNTVSIGSLPGGKTKSLPTDTAKEMLAAIPPDASPPVVPVITVPKRRGVPPTPSTDFDLMDYTGSGLASTTQLDVPEQLDNDFDYKLTVYRAPKGPDFFRVSITGRRSLSRLRTMAKDVVFLLDTSGSIAQPWVNGVTRGIRDSLSGLNPRDRFNIVLFDETPRFFSPRRIRPADAQAISEARSFLAGTQSEGYTDVNHALSRLLVRDVDDDRVYSLILISDGKPTRGVMDTKELINRITRDNDLNAGIYCIGIGGGQNRPLLDFLAYRNRGYSVFVEQAASTAKTIRDLVSRIRYPILKQVRLDAIGVDVVDVVPRVLPDIHQAQRTVVFGRFGRSAASDLTIRVQGANHGQDYDFTFRRSLEQAEPGTSLIARDWAFQKLHHLYSQMLDADHAHRVQKQIDVLRRTYKLKTLY